MKQLILGLTLLCTAPAFALATALAPAPAPGKFDWNSLRGDYSFVSCRAFKDTPIWGDEIALHYVEISNHNQVPNTLNLYREKYEGTILGLAVSIERINEGVYREWDETGRKLLKEIRSFSTKTGVYGKEFWNVQDINIGRSTVELRQIAKDTLELHQTLKFEEDAFARDETCVLKRTVP